MNNNTNTVKVSESGALILDTPRASPQLRSSPKHRGIRVTFDQSSLNSSPKSRSSREKDEEEFRTNVAQTLGLTSGPIPLKTPCVKPSERPMEKGPEKHLSVDDVTGTGLPENKIPPVDYDVPRLDTDHSEKSEINNDNDVNERRDGMAEYAAHYKEPPPAYTDVSDSPITHTTSSQDDVSGPKGTGNDVSSRRELREPDGASGTSSPSSTAPKDATGGKDPPFNRGDKLGPEKEPKPRSPDKKKYSGAGVEELEPVQDKNKDYESPKVPGDDVPDIPSTNIAVACLVTFCFNLPFGALAVYFSLMATKAYRDGKPKQGAKKARISIYISLFSIVLTVLIVMAVVLMKAIEGQRRQRRYYTKTSVSL